MIPAVPATTVPTVVDGAYCHSTPLGGLTYFGLVPLDSRLLPSRFLRTNPFLSLPSRSPCLAPCVQGWRSSSLSGPGSLGLGYRLFLHGDLHHFGYTYTYRYSLCTRSFRARRCWNYHASINWHNGGPSSTAGVFFRKPLRFITIR